MKEKVSAENRVREIRRKTRKKQSSEEKGRQEVAELTWMLKAWWGYGPRRHPFDFYSYNADYLQA